MSTRVFFLIRVDSIGGAERTLVTGLPALAAAGVEATLCVLDACAGENPFFSVLEEAGISWQSVKDPGRPRARVLWRLGRMLRAGRFDCIHTHGYRAAWYGVALGKSLGLPLLSTRHGLLSRHLRERVVEGIEAQMMRFFDAVICVAPHLAEGIPTATHTIPNAVSLPALDALRWPASKPTRLLYVGRLSQEKNLFFLLRVLAPILRQRPGLHFALVGEGPEAAALRRWIEAQGLTEQVFLRGFHRDPTPFYRRADVLLLSSLREGLPMVALEAMAEGLPVVATAVGALPRLLEGEPRRGYALPLHDERAYAEAVTRLVDSPDLARALGQESRAYIEEFYALPQWARAHRELYLTLQRQGATQ